MIQTLAGKSSKTFDAKRKNTENKIIQGRGENPTVVPCGSFARPIPQHWWQNHLLNSIPCQEMPPGPCTQACAGTMPSQYPVQQQHMATRLYGEQRSPHLQDPKSNAGLCSTLHCTASKFPHETACQRKAWLLGGERRGDLKRKINAK